MQALRTDSFEQFMAERRNGWLDLVSKVTGHRLRVEDAPAEEGEELSYELAHESIAPG